MGYDGCEFLRADAEESTPSGAFKLRILCYRFVEFAKNRFREVTWRITSTL
jgi:hypothetical protein